MQLKPAVDPDATPPVADVAGIMQVKVWLLGISPMVWRRVLVPDTCTLHELHGMIQVAMGAGLLGMLRLRHRRLPSSTLPA